MRISLALCALAIVAVSSGCSSLPPMLPDSQANQVGGLLSYYHRVVTAPSEIQRREFLEANDAYARDSSPTTALRLALVLTIPGTPWRDDGRAAQLLAGIDHSPETMSSPMGDFIVLMEKMIQLRRDDTKRCDTRIDTMRDERRKLEQKLEGAREECRRADLLQQKLDELRDIDRDLRTKRPSKRSK